MKTKAILSSVFLLYLCGTSFSADKTVELKAAVGYEHNNNVIYSEISQDGGADFITSGYLRASFSPFFSDAFSIKLGGHVDLSDYQKRPAYNTHGQSADITLMCRPLWFNYFYVMLGSSGYTIGDLTDSSSKSSSIQYIFDVTASSRFWTTLFLDRVDESYTDPTYKPLGGPSAAVGVKQNISELLYLLAKSVDYRAEEEDLTYGRTSATIGIERIAAPWFGIRGAVTVSETKYKEPWFLLPVKKREDSSVSGFLSLSREIAANLTLEIEYAYVNNRCNLKVEETRQGYASYNQSALRALLAFEI